MSEFNAQECADAAWAFATVDQSFQKMDTYRSIGSAAGDAAVAAAGQREFLLCYHQCMRQGPAGMHSDCPLRETRQWQLLASSGTYIASINALRRASGGSLR